MGEKIIDWLEAMVKSPLAWMLGLIFLFFAWFIFGTINPFKIIPHIFRMWGWRKQRQQAWQESLDDMPDPAFDILL